MRRHLSGPARLAAGALSLALLLAAPAGAQQGDSATAARGQPARKQARAVRLEGRAPAIDGRLDDAAWANAPALTGFTQKEPVEAAPASERTELRFVFDEEALYVAARMYSARPDSIRTAVSRRDNAQDAERIQISLDTYLDRRTAYTFGVTAGGVRLDFYHPEDEEYSREFSWDPVWEGKARTDSAGWTAEMRIPFSQLRFTARPEQTWGINANRWIPSRNEDQYWVLIPRRETGWSSRMGELSGITGVRPTRRVEMVPYAASDVRLAGDPDPDDPFAEARETGVRLGGDVRMGLGPSLTLEATVNPDFGQVEADPAEVNLSAFETFFGERRPFFTEANRALEGSGPSYFYSRRIGQRPRMPLDADYTDYPDATTILGAAKLTGRLPSGTTVGALAAVSDAEEARTFDVETGEFGRARVAPRALYGAGRVQQEFAGGARTAGLTLAAVRRGIDDGDALGGRYAGSALSGGGDFNLRLRGGEYEVEGYAGFSHVEGDTAVIRRLQDSPARYFGRPDADHVRLDPTRTSLSGYTAYLGMERNAGRWLWEAGAGAESPGFDLNDAGRLSTADGVSGYASLRYRQTTPGRVFRNWTGGLSSENEWDYAGVRRFGALRTDWNLTWKNFWSTNLTGWVDLRAQSPTATRGGPRLGTGRAWVVIGRLANSVAARTRWNGRVYYGENEQGERTYRLSGGLSVQPGPRWTLSVDPNYLRTTDPRQYVTTLDEGGPEATLGRSYVFAFIDRSELLAQFRAAYAFTPDLSLEMYAEPFASSGRYYDFGELPAPRSRDLTFFGPTGPVRSDGGVHTVGEGEDAEAVAEDFNVRSFRSNAVLRWEWRPGSTLFVVWQQDRSADERTGRLVRPGDLWNALGATGDNYLAVKMTYWIPVR